MRLRLLLLPPVILLCLVTVGCGTFEKSFAMFRPNSSDGWDPTDNPDPQWDSVGVEARGGQALEYENDPSRKYLMSRKARAIERNLGIGD